jgi:ribosomal protein S18 acetylase RimI-like enzyme
MINPTIRTARIEDAELLAAFAARLSQAEGAAPPRFDAEICRRDGFGGVPRFAALIAEIDGRPAGYALHHRSYDTDRVVRAEWLADLYVENWARGHGLGLDLVRHVARRAAKDGAEGLHWDVLRSNTPARAFYRRFAREDERLLHCHVEGEALARLAGAARASDASIRGGRTSDAPIIARFLGDLLRALGEHVFEFDATARIAADGFGAVPRFSTLIAERNGAIVGYALFWPIYSTDAGGEMLFLSDLFVIEEARGAGIARDLMRAVAERATADGCRSLYWEVLPANSRARAFYRRIAREDDAALVVNCADEDFRKLLAEKDGD